MPSVSDKQHNLMEMVAHDPAAAKRVGVPQSVGQDFSEADKGRSFHRAMQASGLSKGNGRHKRHPATSHYKGASVSQAQYRSKV